KLSVSNNEIDIAEAEKLDKILQPVHNAMFIESNPSPVKYAAKLMDLCDDAVRLPLVKTSEKVKPVIKKALESAKLI
ncbi:dihydrodipicolinate synthase family protein, partial [Candidatus Pelagibacter sp.]|nr:dihydrodipicolinate synthase family protein [Candidatus Pelagibacter sp.]